MISQSQELGNSQTADHYNKACKSVCSVCNSYALCDHSVIRLGRVRSCAAHLATPPGGPVPIEPLGLGMEGDLRQFPATLSLLKSTVVSGLAEFSSRQMLYV